MYGVFQIPILLRCRSVRKKNARPVAKNVHGKAGRVERDDRLRDAALRRLAEAVRYRREALDLTQEEVAAAAHLLSRHYQKIEAGEANVTIWTLAHLAVALRCKTRDLV